MGSLCVYPVGSQWGACVVHCLAEWAANGEAVPQACCTGFPPEWEWRRCLSILGVVVGSSHLTPCLTPWQSSDITLELTT